MDEGRATRPARYKRVAFAAGALALAGALTIAALSRSEAAAAAPTHVPPDEAVVARVPRGRVSGDEVARARQWIARARASGDARHHGRAQAALAAWWDDPAPPAEVWLLRATIRQANHDFAGALQDLDGLLAADGANAQALLTRAVVLGVRGERARALADCVALEPLAPELVVAACRAPVADGPDAYARLAAALESSPGAAAGLRAWALASLGELARARGELELAARHLEASLRLDDDVTTRAALADLWLEAGRREDVLRLVAGRDDSDVLLLRQVLAGGPGAETLRARLAGDPLHLRERARFALEVDGDADEALRLARENWQTQREAADARIYRAAAEAR